MKSIQNATHVTTSAVAMAVSVVSSVTVVVTGASDSAAAPVSASVTAAVVSRSLLQVQCQNKTQMCQLENNTFLQLCSQLLSRGFVLRT